MAERHTLYFDESGFTGEDLANASQPIFVLASHDLTEDECGELRKRHFAKVQARELKHEQLQRRPRQRRMVVSLLEDLATAYPGRIRCSVVHKRYALVGKMVDHLIHSAMEEDGIDLYEHGNNIALTNLLYMALPALMGDGGAFMDRVLQSFQLMVRERTRDAYDAFFRPLFMRGFPDEVEKYLALICSAHLKLGPSLLDDLGPRALDVSLTCALQLAARWRKTYPLPTTLGVVHDASSQMTKERAVWDALTDPGVPTFVTGYDRRTMEYPVAVATTSFQDSAASVAVQIADVVAGSLARGMAACEDRSDEYGEQVRRVVAKHESFVSDAVWPHKAVTPSELGTEGRRHGDILLDTALVAFSSRSRK